MRRRTLLAALPALAMPSIARASDEDVKIGNITHTYNSDLDIFLIAPNGTRVELSTDNGTSGDNFIDTIFDDAAATPT